MTEIVTNTSSSSPALQMCLWGQPVNHSITLMKSHTSSFHHPWRASAFPLPHCGAQRWKLEQKKKKKNGAQVTRPDWQLRKQMLGFIHLRGALFHAVRNISLSVAGGIATQAQKALTL